MHGIVKPVWCLQPSPRITQFHQDAIFFLTADTENAKKLKKKIIKKHCTQAEVPKCRRSACRGIIYSGWSLKSIEAEVKISAGIPAQAWSQTERVKKCSGNERRPRWAEPALLWLLLPSRRSSRERKALGREWVQLKGTSVVAVQCPLECTAQQVHSRQCCPEELRAFTAEAGRRFVANLMSILQLLWIARGTERVRTSGEYCSWCELVLLHCLWQFHGGTDWMKAWFVGSALQNSSDQVGPPEDRQCRNRSEKGVSPQWQCLWHSGWCMQK